GVATDRGMPVVRLEPGGPPVVAALLRAPEDFRPEAVQRLAFLDATTGETVREAELEGLAHSPPRFPGMSDRFEPWVAAADLDGDGAEEILVTFLHEIYWPSYTVLYEPRLGRARPVLTASGHHRFAGAEDLDGDGRAELLFFGINNRMGYQTAVAAVAPVPPVGDATELAASQETLAGSPDRIATSGSEGETHWYALLEGRPAAPFLKIDRAGRRIVVSGPGGEGAIALGYDGFRADRPAPPGLAPASRQELRRQAYRALRDAVQLREAGSAESVAKAREAAELARRVGEEGLAAWAPVVEATALAATGETAAAERLFAELAVPGSQVVETALRAGEAFFLAGERERAVAWYRRGLELVREPAAGRNPAALLEGLVFARAADGRYRDAESELATFGRAHPNLVPHADALRLFLRWREGETPDPRWLAHPRATDLWRYWSLELRLARGEAPEAILEALAGELPRASETVPLLLSLEGECLARLGRRDEALERAREALDGLAAAPLARLALEAHRPLLEERLARLTAAGSGGG
ncbi:MAG TPA: VCBS repeat-containing protein, partial [Thermoanaerobaculia bacterium]|nr:VCBS repeat-containing protein [Thermoanaerobaculia bacterium]